MSTNELRNFVTAILDHEESGGHVVTKEQVGLGNIEDYGNVPIDSHAVGYLDKNNNRQLEKAFILWLIEKDILKIGDPGYVYDTLTNTWVLDEGTL